MGHGDTMAIKRHCLCPVSVQSKPQNTVALQHAQRRLKPTDRKQAAKVGCCMHVAIYRLYFCRECFFKLSQINSVLMTSLQSHPAFTSTTVTVLP